MRERTALTAAMIDRLPRLQLIVTTAMWNASVDIAHARSRGIVVSGTRSIRSGTPELVWLLILALARRFEAERASLRGGGWQTGVGVDLAGSTLGVMGLGEIGGRTAKIANAFGMRVIAWSQNLTPERAREAGATWVDKDTLLAESDFLTINLKLSQRTHHIVGAAELARMKPTAFLVNISRGPLVDEAALIAALRERRIAGAGLDVYDVEPPPVDHPFRALPNVIATPHIGYVTQDAFRLFYPQIVENVDAWLRGEPLRRLPVEA
jgi:phosphoglycerate dehydrogenase-like enzyme